MDTEKLNELREIELEIMDEIIRICEKHRIKYYLAGGSALGAVRHQGMIPWDDDIDILMLRADYIKFSELCKTELKKEYFYQSQDTDINYIKRFAKVRKNNTIFLEKEFVGVDQHNGVFVDVFPIDEARKKIGIQKYQYKFSKWMEMLMQIKAGRLYKGKFLTLIAKICPRSFLINLQTKSMTLFNSSKCKYYVNFGSQYGVIKQTMEKSVYDPAVALPFEGRMCYVPGNYKQYLTNLFGADYMQLPPLEKRVTHDPIEFKW